MIKLRQLIKILKLTERKPALNGQVISTQWQRPGGTATQITCALKGQLNKGINNA